MIKVNQGMEHVGPNPRPGLEELQVLLCLTRSVPFTNFATIKTSLRNAN